MNKPTEKGLATAADTGRKTITRKGGELVAEFLVKERIPYVFGLCGHGIVGLLDPLYAVRDRVKYVSPRHEQTAAHMADGYFRVKHRPVATLTSTGPGSANIIMALAVAQTDSSALLAITANVPTSQFNRGPFQELNRHNQADFPSVIRPVVKRSFQPTRVDMLPLALRQGSMEIEGRRQVVRKHDVIFIPPGVRHSICNNGLTDLTFIVVTAPVEDQ
jgi:acetolactate synthase-1/2/3 large subunit